MTIPAGSYKVVAQASVPNIRTYYGTAADGAMRVSGAHRGALGRSLAHESLFCAPTSLFRRARRVGPALAARHSRDLGGAEDGVTEAERVFGVQGVDRFFFCFFGMALKED